MIHQVEITTDNAHRLLKDRKITAEEYDEFIMNFLYETTLNEATRSRIGIPKVQVDDAIYEDIPLKGMSDEELSYAINVIKIVEKAVSDVEDDVRTRHRSRTRSTYNDNLEPYYGEYVYSFEELTSMCHKYFEQAKENAEYVDYTKFTCPRERNERRLIDTFHMVWDDCKRIAYFYYYDIMIGGWQFA